MAAEVAAAAFPMEKEAAEEEIALLVRKPGFGELTVGDIIRHMNNRFNLNFSGFKKELKQMVMGELSKIRQEQGNGSDDESSSSSGSDSESEDDEPKVEPKKEAKGSSNKQKKEVKKEVGAVQPAAATKHDDSDSDSGVEDSVLPKGKRGAARVQTDMASKIKSSRRAAASEAMKQIRNTSGGGRFNGKVKKEKDPNADHSGKFGPMTKLCYISTELQQVTKDQWMKRCDVVKVLWDYIKENNLKDPKNGQFFICDSVLEPIFKKKKVKAFGMQKFLTRHIIGTNDMAPDMREEAEQEMDKRRKEWKERESQRKAEARGESSSKSGEPAEPAAKKIKKSEESDKEEDDKDEDDKESSSSSSSDSD